VTFHEARAQFPVLERYAYLNAGTFGPMPRSVADAVCAEQRRALDEGRINAAAYARYVEWRARVRERFAELLEVDAERVAITSSTTESCNVVLNGLGLAPGDEVVTSDMEHFGLAGALAVSPATVRVARILDRPVELALDALLAEVSSQTRLIALSEVSWVTGQRLPWRELRERTGLPVLVDGAQSVAAIPVEAGEADFYTVSAQKWLCGPDMTGALYARDPDALRIAQPSYLSVQSYDMATATFEPRKGAARFDTQFTPLSSTAGLLAAFDVHPEWRFERALATGARCRDLLSERFDVVTPPGHSTLVSFRHEDTEGTVKRLYERGVIVRDLPGTGLVRVSCGWWTSDEDLERLMAALGTVAA
jgi:L-cysteine/cystine lyase